MGKPKILQLEGEILFENENGLNDNIQLNKDIENFSKIEVYYKYAIGDYIVKDSKRAIIEDGDCVALNFILAHSDSLQLFVSGRYIFQGQQLKKVYATRSRMGEDGTTVFDGTINDILITKIIGY